ncbi:MAG: hypothetical protein LBL55_08270 [Propionibacteriaceae bacterium]|jgi:uncharacterized protein with PQ loop repeat|nr:hypothetical protein [Propionibacteriaceae bacterium]
MGLTVLGWLAAASSAAVALPQLVRLWRSGLSAGVSLLLWQLCLCTSIGWTIHGFHVTRANMVVPNIFCAVVSGLVMHAVATDRRLDWWRVYPAAALAGLVVGGMDWLTPPVLFGLIMLVPALIGQLSQARDLCLRPDIRGVSVVYLGVNLLVQLLWFAWSLGSGDRAISWCAALTGLAILSNLGLYGARHLGWRRPQPAPLDESEPAGQSEPSPTE